MFNTRLKLELKATKTQLKDIFNYFKKKSCKIDQLEMDIDQLSAAKTKTNIVFSLIEILINMSQYFIYVLYFLAYKSQMALNMQQNLSKTLYND